MTITKFDYPHRVVSRFFSRFVERGELHPTYVENNLKLVALATAVFEGSNINDKLKDLKGVTRSKHFNSTLDALNEDESLEDTDGKFFINVAAFCITLLENNYTISDKFDAGIYLKYSGMIDILTCNRTHHPNYYEVLIIALELFGSSITFKHEVPDNLFDPEVVKVLRELIGYEGDGVIDYYLSSGIFIPEDSEIKPILPGITRVVPEVIFPNKPNELFIEAYSRLVSGIENQYKSSSSLHKSNLF